ncbi:hypothetical protein T459_17088 [Capsicum annuum]|uniref:Uncharacterized protein n=1 Tax=Capsicum annuum TaxID=4072 RepID=A0A2G2ZAJ8_CAPAN|nr:hypothetical protein T459_17088 [Capsicum annuum]
MYNNKGIAFAEYGDYWKQMRKICTTELLSAKMVKSFSSIQKDELLNVLSSIDSCGGTCEVKMTERIVRFTSSVTCRLVFEKLCRDRDELINLMKDALFLVGGFDVGDFFPSWKLLYKKSVAKSKMVKMQQNVDSVLESIINEHIKNRAMGTKGNGAYGEPGPMSVLCHRCWPPYYIVHASVNGDMFTGGTETSSTTIIWAMSELMKHPDIMVKAQSGVRQAFKEKTDFDEEDLDNLPYLKLVIKETLRLHSPNIVHRECREETIVDGYTIPAKATVLVNTWAMGRDPEVWDDPESFIPERFENSPIDYLGNNYEYLPFGAGKRICPGM